MTQENNIIVPHWFLEVVENALRIQNDINLDKKTEETCQDRNIRQLLNGVRKLLNGEELTGMERLEKLQTSLSSNLDEAADEYANKSWIHGGVWHESVKDTFKAGAKWVIEQGVDLTHLIMWYIQSVDAHEPIWTEEHLKELVKDYILIPKD